MRKTCIYILLFVLVFTGCLPTPTEEVVIHKNEGTLEQQLSATAAPAYRVEIKVAAAQTQAPAETEKPVETAPQSTEAAPAQNGLQLALGAPERVQETFEGEAVGGRLTVVMDADVEIPPVEKVPVLRGQVGYEPEKAAERITKLLLGDGPYIRPGHSERGYLQPQIEFYQRWLEALEQKPYGPGADYDAIRENLQENFNTLTQIYRDATGADDRPDKPWTGSFADAKEAFSISDGKKGFGIIGGGEVFSYGASSCGCTGSGILMDNPRGPRNEEEKEWLQHAVDFAKGLGYGEVIPQFINDDDESTRMRYETETGFDSGCKHFTLLPVYEGIPVYPYTTMYGSDTGRQAAGIPFARNLEQEEIFGTLYQGEVVKLQWNSPFTVTGVENENVPLLPFERIMEIFKRQVFMSVYLDEGHPMTYCVTKVQFSYMRVQVRDKSDYYLLPVWDFVGYVEHDWNMTPGERAVSRSLYNSMSVLTINGVDGSVLDRFLGY